MVAKRQSCLACRASCRAMITVARPTPGLSGFFFFSSRRRHTRCGRDWSSDVCSSDLFAFRCVLVDASQRYTMFLRDGTPVRATLSVKFQEFADVTFEVRQGFFIGAPTIERAVEGQTVAQVSAATLGDAGRWREIAHANDIDDPFNLPPGQAVTGPKGGAT